MDKRIIIIGIGCAAFALHAMSGQKPQSEMADAAYATQARAVALPTSSGAGRVNVDVFNIRRGGAGVKIQNISGEHLKSVFLHCTFRNQYGERIDSVPIYVSSLDAGDTANESAEMGNDIKASTVDCRTEYAHTD